MTCGSVLPFPLGRRHSLVKRLAAQLLARAPREADRHLAFELRRHRRALRRRQVSEDIILAQLRSLEGAVRSELWHFVLTPDQPSGKV